MKNLVVVDIDGTLSDASERAAKYLSQEPKDWDGFYAACGDDKPIKPVIKVVEEFSQTNYIVFCTGRRESCSRDTFKWLYKHVHLHGNNQNPAKVVMYRKDGDKRHDTIVKPEMLREYLSQHPEYRVLCILEDRNSMVAKWRELGYTCLQVAEGDF